VAGHRNALYRVALAAMVVFGIVLAVPGTILNLPDVTERLRLTFSSRGLLISALFVGSFTGSALIGPIVDVVGHRVALGGSALLIAICLPLFAAAPSSALAAGALVATGFACAGVNTASNALSSDLFPEERGKRMNGLAIAVGVGGLTLPAATALTSHVAPWHWVIGAGAALAATVAVAAAMVRVEMQRAVAARPPIGRVLRQPGLVWVALLVLLAAGTEAVMAGFTATYLTALGFRVEQATWALSAHWIGLIAGRLAFARYLDRAKVGSIVTAATAGAAGVLLLVGAASPWLLAAAPFAVGVAIGIIMPTALALGGERYPHNAGTLFGVLLMAAQAGAGTLPAIVGLVAERAGVREGMAVLALNNVLIAMVCGRASRLAR
jgi:fucose permease